jgi:hypothetical protein
MKKSGLLLLFLLGLISHNYSQQIMILKDEKMNAWKQCKLYMLKTVDEEINKVFESSLKASFPNYAGSVSLEESKSIMGNENNFLALVYYPGCFEKKPVDHIAMGIGILQAEDKKLPKHTNDLNYRSMLVYQDYVPFAPTMNVSFLYKEVREINTKNEAYKTFKPEPNLIALIPSTILSFKQYIEAMDKTMGVETLKTDKKKMVSVGKELSQNAKILKNKTLLVLDNPVAEEFYNAYAFKKEKMGNYDLSKIKDKNYCLLKYTHVLGDLMQVSVTDCETGLLIYTENTYASNTNLKPMTKEMAENLNSAVNGNYKAIK